MRQKKNDHAKTKKSNENAMTFTTEKLREESLENENSISVTQPEIINILSKNTQMLSTKPQFHQNNAIAMKKSCGNNEKFYCIQRPNGQTLVRKPLSQTVFGPENV